VGTGDFLLRVLVWHLIPSISSVLFVYAFISFASWLSRVKESNWLYWLYSIPLIKGVIIFIQGTSHPPPMSTTRPIMIALRLWDPFEFISVPAALETTPATFYTPTTSVIAIVVISLIASILLWRWASLTLFYRSLAQSERLQRDDDPRFFAILDKLVNDMHTVYPKIIVSDKNYLFPCSIGIRHPNIILSPELIEESSDEVLEAMLAHELAHLKRRDSILHWISIVLRDLLFFNPFAHLVFKRIILAKEKDCDRITVTTTKKPKALESAIVNALMLAEKSRLIPLPGDLSRTGGLLSKGIVTKKRILVLDHIQDEKKSSVWTKVALMAIAIFIMLLNIHIFFVNPQPFLVIQL
jgi:beta-lactamase regulating signal transducer with metallopeptidase domain